jgi:ABC-type phosphate transport system auxiliary subunit
LAEVHLVIGVVMMALNLVAGLWGAVAWASNRASVSFWYVLRAAQVSVVVQVLLGALLLVAGREAVDGIHYMYGTAPLLVNLFAEGMRAGAAQRELPEDVAFETLPTGEQRTIALRIVRREMGTMAIACLLIVAFALRAAQVSGGLF